VTRELLDGERARRLLPGHGSTAAGAPVR
jgi:hypothetical protein